MRPSRWSLDQLVARVGAAALMVLFVPTGLYFTLSISSSAEAALAERGQSLANALVSQLVKPILLGDQLALHEALQTRKAAEQDLRYLCIEDARGQVVAHTFEGGFPPALSELWRGNSGQVIRYRTKDEALLDVSAPILNGRLGTLHVGMSRGLATSVGRRMMWAMAAALVMALSLVLVGAHLVAAKVSRPLQQLEAEVSRLPAQRSTAALQRISGTREVESLARGFSDMTRRLESLERERAATQERMVHAERLAALGEMAAGLAHEIHNPLDGMQECLRYLDADPAKGERAAKYYPMLQNGLERIAGVMQGMLTFTRSGQKVAMESCPMAEVVESLKLLVQTHLAGRRVRLTWQPTDGCICLCNRNGLSQAVLNLVLNAAEAAEGGRDPEVRIEATCDSQWVYLGVEDSGPGVPPELCDRVFDPFFTTKPTGKGTGLGLSVSRQLIRAAGGELELAAGTGGLGGARFVIRMPRAPSRE